MTSITVGPHWPQWTGIDNAQTLLQLVKWTVDASPIRHIHFYATFSFHFEVWRLPFHRFDLLLDSQGCVRPVQGLFIFRSRKTDSHVRSLLHGVRRERIRWHRTWSPGILAQVLHRRRELGHGRKQHARFFRAGWNHVPGPHPQPEEESQNAFERPERVLGFSEPRPGITAPGMYRTVCMYGWTWLFSLPHYLALPCLSICILCFLFLQPVAES